MADLEESIFQRNVPGRYSKWDREEGVEGEEEFDPTDVEREISEENECEEMQLLRCAEQLSKADVPEPIRQRILAERATKSATGVKGVLADYKAAQALALAEAQADALARQEIITRMVEGVRVKSTAEQILEEQVLAADGDSSECDLSDDEADDAFMREFRAKRLQELKQASSVQPVKAPIFGEVREIRAEEFLAEIEQVDPAVTVVVHLYEPAVQGCVRMNGMLDELAATMPHLKFLRMQASSNEIEVDRVALPILTLYRAGETVGTLAGIVADFGQYFTLQDVTWLLQTSIPP